jgi:LysR family glycine cleavage system transcriptional activator
MRLPSLNALRAFEAAARLGSLTRAAEELHVTPSAVRHQVRALEEEIGRPLLRKNGMGIAPSEVAGNSLGHLRRAFDALAEANRVLRQPVDAQVLTVAAVPSFVSSWLVPRLDGFRVLYPCATVRVDTSWGVSDFRRDGVDVAIRYGLGGYTGMFECRLFSETYFPVCAPQLVDGPVALREPADLAEHTLLHSGGVTPGGPSGWPVWRDWLEAAGVADRVDPDGGTHYSVSMFAHQAAMAGQGVSLGTTVLTRDMLHAGYLVKPFALELATPFGYHIVCPPESRERPMVAVFIDWLLATAGEACTGMDGTER